ncbi:MAG: YihY/virulence factor BrkB family protein [Flavisolibacter sp.]
MSEIIRDSMYELLKNDPLRMAGATAFFTTFALPPILVILIQVLKLLFDPQRIRNELFTHLENIIGTQSVQQVVDVLQALREMAQNWWITGLGFLFLVFVATTLFKVIRNSLNQVWKMRIIRKRGIYKGVGARLKSVAIIIVAAILFVVGIFAEGVQALIGHYVFELSPLLSVYLNSVLSYFISILVVTLWFAIVFRYLPDGRPDWDIAFSGAFFTAILFSVGKLIVHWLLTYSNINTLYGTSASIVLLLLFVFYSALILYYGASFTKLWALHKGRPIKPVQGAMHYKVTEADESEYVIMNVK